MPQRIIIEVNNLFKRDRIVRNLELFQDIIVISLCVSLFCVMLIRLGDMFLSFLSPLDLRQFGHWIGTAIALILSLVYKMVQPTTLF